MKNKRTYYQLILDRSGSMTRFVEETVTGVNSQIRRIKELGERFPDQELITSLCLFNNNVYDVFDRVKITDLKELSYQDYCPDGTTALNDAIGHTITNLQNTIGHEVETDEASVVVVIFTDGFENASRHFTHVKISSLIEELEHTGRWMFSYIGATFDAVTIARRMNIRSTNAARYSVQQTGMVFMHVADKFDQYVSEKHLGNICKDFLNNKSIDD